MRFGELIREFSEDNYGRLVDLLNTGLYKLSTKNLDVEVITVTLPLAGTEIAVHHNLKTTPKYRIIIRQTGNGVVEDGITEWTDKNIYLKAAAVSTQDLTVSVMIVRG